MVPAPQSRKMHSVFFTIFFSLLLVLVIELTLLIGTIIVGQDCTGLILETHASGNQGDLIIRRLAASSASPDTSCQSIHP